MSILTHECPECKMKVDSAYTVFLHGFYHGAIHERERNARKGD